MLERMDLGDRADRKAGSLPYGDERRIGLLRVFTMMPALLMLDAPAAGMNETESHALMAAIADIRDEFGCGVLVIEHDMRVIMRLRERIQVLDYSKTISVGTPAQVQRDPAVITAYLGTKRGASAAAAPDPSEGHRSCGRRHDRLRSPGRRLASIDKEARMAIARVVSFEGVSKERMDELDREMRDGEQPEGLAPTEIVVLHDPEAEKSLVILFFETEEDYKKGDEVLNAMPSGDTPGQRTSVEKYNVASRMTT